MLNIYLLKGKLQRNIDFSGNSLKVPENVIEKGYKRPFVETPENCSFVNKKTTKKNKQFLSQCLAELLKDNPVIVEYISYGFNLLSVSTNAPRKLILDLRYEQLFVKRETTDHLKTMFQVIILQICLI